MAQCAACTYEIPAGAPVCTTCGAPAPAEAPGAPAAAKGMDEWLLRGMSFVLVAIVLAAAAFTVWSMVGQMSGS